VELPALHQQGVVALRQAGLRVVREQLLQAGPVGQRGEDQEQPRAEELAAPSVAARERVRERARHAQACRKTLTAGTSFTAKPVTQRTSIAAAEFATCMPEAWTSGTMRVAGARSSAVTTMCS
jgi:hypothetical protein